MFVPMLTVVDISVIKIDKVFNKLIILNNTQLTFGVSIMDLVVKKERVI